MILAGGIIGFIIITTAFKNIKGKFTKKDMYCNLKINFNFNSVYTKAIIDTGNFLKDPISKYPVIVVERRVMEERISKQVLDNLQKFITGEEVVVGEFAEKVKLIPFTSLGNENGLLVGIKVDNVVVNFDEKNIYIKNVIIGIYNGILSKNDKYRALVGLELLEEKGRGERI